MTDHRTTPQRGSRHNIERLASLDEWQLEDESDDLRGHILFDHAGHPIGKITEMLVDLDEERVAALRLENGQVVDIDTIDIRDGRPVLLSANPAAAHGNSPVQAGVSADRGRTPDGDQRVPIVQEELDIGKRVANLGSVRVRTRVIEQPVSQDVTLQRERVDVQRRPADRALAPSEADALLKDNMVEMVERGEEAVVGKSARVVEEVVVRKGTENYTQHVEGTVRRTDVEVDRDGKPMREPGHDSDRRG
jgi:uncharacterized protein (TIGR02271 family)